MVDGKPESTTVLMGVELHSTFGSQLPGSHLCDSCTFTERDIHTEVECVTRRRAFLQPSLYLLREALHVSSCTQRPAYRGSHPNKTEPFTKRHFPASPVQRSKLFHLNKDLQLHVCTRHHPARDDGPSPCVATLDVQELCPQVGWNGHSCHSRLIPPLCVSDLLGPTPPLPT